MNSERIKAMIQDCGVVREEAVKAINTPPHSAYAGQEKHFADAMNRVAVGVTLLAESVLGLQLEGTVVREAFAEGKKLADNEIADIMTNAGGEVSL